MATTKVKQSTRTLGTGEVVDANIATDTISIGKISGSAAASAGTYLKQDGTWAAVASGIAWQAVQTTGFTAVAEKGYPCNTTAGAFTVTLPASASVGDEIAIVDYAGTFDTNNLTINPNSLNVRGATTSLLVNKERIGIVLTYVDATQGWVATSGANTGTSSMALPTYTADFLVIAGGGGGGHDQGGGGGAGGYRASYNSEASGGGGSSEASLTFNSGIVYTVSVGAGGAGVSSGTSNDGVDSFLSGSDITTITSVGGGKGSLYNTSGAGVGGSGGGAAGGSSAPAAGTANQGYGGGSGTTYIGGGGGGAGAVGNNYSGTTAGSGGAGASSTISGGSVTRGGGGGGAAAGSGGGATRYGGAGGAGGGGRGSVTGWSSDVDGTANTGGGGGGTWGGSPTGSGGKGVVILRMLTSYYTATTTGSPTETTLGTDTILTFNDTGSYTA
jgi:hypothetical protein